MAANIYDWSTTAASNATADTDLTWAEGQAPSTVNNSARVMMQRTKQLLVDLGGSITAGGTANALTVAAQSPFAALADGQIVSFRAAATNTAAATINVNLIGSKAIMKLTEAGPVALAGGEIQNTGLYVVQYSTALNGGVGAWLLQNATAADQRMLYQTKSGNYTALISDNNAFIRFTASATLSLPAAATLTPGWHLHVKADFGGGNVTIDPNGSETINSATTIVIPRGEGALIICDGTGFFTLATPSTVVATSPGYVRLPSGIIIQWGVSTNVSTDYSVTLPVAFVAGVFSVQLTPSINAGLSNLYSAVTSNASTTAFDIRTRVASNGGAVGGQASLTVFWLVIGI